MKTKILLAGLLAAGLFVSPSAAWAGGWGGRGFYGGGGGNWGGFHGGFYNGYRFYGGGYGYPWWGWWPPINVGVAFYPTPDYGYPYYGYGAPYGGNAYYGNSSNGYAYGTVTQAVQSALARRGYYRGAIDGVLGPETRSAIRSFQAQRGLAVTGQIDSNLIRALQK